MRPLTIKQINSAQNKPGSDSFTVDGAPVTHLTFVGQILNVAVASTNTTFSLLDGTGRLNVKYWHTDLISDEDASDAGGAWERRGLVTHAWVRVFGKLRAFNDERTVQATVLRPVPDLNEINYHFLECTAVHLHYTKGPPQVAAAPGMGVKKEEPGTNGMAAYGAAKDPYAAGPGGAYGSGAAARLNGSSKTVYQAIAAAGTPEGLHVNNIAAQTGLPMIDIMKAGDELLSNSLIFQTVDDDTWGLMGE